VVLNVYLPPAGIGECRLWQRMASVPHWTCGMTELCQSWFVLSKTNLTNLGSKYSRFARLVCLRKPTGS
jgi:hypothetical protein